MYTKMYTNTNYKTGKAVKDDLKAGKQIAVYDNSIVATGEPVNGRVAICGPHYPAPHKWYLSVDVKDGIITKIHK